MYMILLLTIMFGDSIKLFLGLNSEFFLVLPDHSLQPR